MIPWLAHPRFDSPSRPFKGKLLNARPYPQAENHSHTGHIGHDLVYRKNLDDVMVGFVGRVRPCAVGLFSKNIEILQLINSLIFNKLCLIIPKDSFGRIFLILLWDSIKRKNM